jgi:hypothetical protein
MKHILLDEKDFEDLTKGKVIEKDGTKIALQDIGYDLMFNILEQNYSNYLNKKK